MPSIQAALRVSQVSGISRTRDGWVRFGQLSTSAGIGTKILYQFQFLRYSWVESYADILVYQVPSRPFNSANHRDCGSTPDTLLILFSSI